MGHMKISAKLTVSFAVIMVLAVIIGSVGIVGLNNMNTEATQMYKSHLVAVQAMGDLRYAFGTQRSDLRGVFLYRDDPLMVQNLIESINAADRRAEDSFRLYETTITNAADEKDFFTAKDTWTGPYANMKREVLALIDGGNFDAAYTVFKAGETAIAPISNGLAASAELNYQWAKDRDAYTEQLFTTLLILLIAVMVLAAAAALIMSGYISSHISKPLIPLTAFMKRAAETGDISHTPDEKAVFEKYKVYKDEIGELLSEADLFTERLSSTAETLGQIAQGDISMDVSVQSDKDTMGNSMLHMVNHLNDMFTDIYEASDQVSTGSSQIADAATSLAQGSTEQAATVQELSASMAEISGKTRENASLASRAAVMAGAIKENAETGSRQMDEMMAAVNEINQASQNISQVIKVIDNIAFQTNILALNASVEAARAGQHGKGFAVVAEEVRNLAAKSAEAANDTGALIVNSTQKAELGARIASETATSLSEIVRGINESAQIINEIAQSSEVQSTGIAQINEAIDHVAIVVQQNSATSEECAASSEELSSQADTLESLIAHFELKNRKPKGKALKNTSALQSQHSGGDTGFALNSTGFDAGKY